MNNTRLEKLVWAILITVFRIVHEAWSTAERLELENIKLEETIAYMEEVNGHNSKLGEECVTSK